MAQSGKQPAHETEKSLGQRFMDHLKDTARGPNGFASIAKEIKYALTDIRHKVVEEASYGRATTPHWRDAANTPQPDSGIHGNTQTPGQDAPGGVHGKADAPAPGGDGGIHGKTEASKPEPSHPDAGGGVHGKAAEPAARSPAIKAEPKGLGMSYAELTASWEKACAPDQAAGRERQPPKEPEPAIER